MDLSLTLLITFSEKESYFITLEITLTLKQGMPKLFIMDQKEVCI